LSKTSIDAPLEDIIERLEFEYSQAKDQHKHAGFWYSKVIENIKKIERMELVLAETQKYYIFLLNELFTIFEKRNISKYYQRVENEYNSWAEKNLTKDSNEAS